MKIYERQGFPNPARIRIVLAEKGLADAVTFQPVDLVGAEHKQAPFLALNPIGKIPVLELDDGTLISECTAITVYLDGLDGRPTLTGSTPRERAMILMMQARAEAMLLSGVDHYFHYATPGLGAAMAPYTSPDWAGRAEWGLRERARAEDGIRYFNEVLATRPYVAGDAFSMADITVFCALMFAEVVGIAVPEACAALLEWRARVAERPGVKARGGQAFLAEDLQRLAA